MMASLTEIALSLFLAAFVAAVIALFINGSRPPQPLETEPPASAHPLANAVAAMLSPGVSILVFYLGVWTGFTNNRIFDAMIALPLVNGAYCGRRAFRVKSARLPVRLAALLAVVVCVPSALLFLLITIFGVG
jgi:hypothetical protein